MLQNIFQMNMDIIVERFPGIIAIHNGVAVYIRDEEDHVANLVYLVLYTILAV